MNSAATANDLKKQLQERLQIDADLANTTDLTASSTFTTPVSEAMRSDEVSDEWSNFYAALKKTPPKAIRDIEYQDAVEKVNRLLRLSDIKGFENKTFDDLTQEQQAIIMFMIIKKMDEITFEGQRSEKLLISVLEPDTEKHKRMLSFVRKAGDTTCRAQSVVVNQFKETCEKFVKDCRAATTIFLKNDGMPPCLYMERECSYICTFNACSALMYYGSYILQSKPGEKQSVSVIHTNISRYIRDEIGGVEIANFTLTTKKGAYLDKILTGLMESFGTVELKPLRIYLEEEQGENWNYDQLSQYLKIGRPFALLIECFPGLQDPEKKEYTGKLSHHYRKKEVEYSER